MLRVIYLVLLVVFLNGCAMFGEEKDKTKSWSQQKLYDEASEELHTGNYEQAVRYYEILQARYPYGTLAFQGQLDIAYAYYRYDEPESALAAADRFIKLHPRHPAVVYAHYLKGLVNFNRGSSILDDYIPTDQAQRDPGAALDSYKDFEVVVTRFADTEYAEDARKRMLFLRNNLARNEIHIAHFYIKRGAFLAAAKRANYVVQNYQRTPSVKRALEIMAYAYTRLGLETLADDAQRVLATNLNNNTLIEEPQELKELNWTQRLWEYFKLDED